MHFPMTSVFWTSGAYRHMIWRIPLKPLESAFLGRYLRPTKNSRLESGGCLFIGMERLAFQHNHDRIRRLPRPQQSRPRMEVD